MEAAVGLGAYQLNDIVKNVLIEFLKSKDFENLSVKEKKEFMIELKNTSYSLKNHYNLFALSYERLLKKDDSTFSDLDTLMTVFLEEFNNIQMEEFVKRINKNKSKYKKTTAAELEAYFAEQFKNIQTEEFEKMINKTKSKCEKITATKITLIIESDEDSEPDFADVFMQDTLIDFSVKTKTNIKSVAMEDL